MACILTLNLRKCKCTKHVAWAAAVMSQKLVSASIRVSAAYWAGLPDMHVALAGLSTNDACIALGIDNTCRLQALYAFP